MVEKDLIICGSCQNLKLDGLRNRLYFYDCNDQIAYKQAYYNKSYLVTDIKQISPATKVAYVPDISLIAERNIRFKADFLKKGISVIDERPKDISEIVTCIKQANKSNSFYLMNYPILDISFFTKMYTVLEEFSKYNEIKFIDIFSPISQTWMLLTLVTKVFSIKGKYRVENFKRVGRMLFVSGHIADIQIDLKIYNPRVDSYYKSLLPVNEMKVLTEKDYISVDFVNKLISCKSDLLERAEKSLESKQNLGFYLCGGCIKSALDIVISFQEDFNLYRIKTQEVLNEFSKFSEVFRLYDTGSFYNAEEGSNENISTYFHESITEDKEISLDIKIKNAINKIEEEYTAYLPRDYYEDYYSYLKRYIGDCIFCFFNRNGLFVDRKRGYRRDEILKIGTNNVNKQIIERWIEELINLKYLDIQQGLYWSKREVIFNIDEDGYGKLRDMWDWKLGPPESLDYLKLNLDNLDKLFFGKIDANELLFPEASVDFARALYSENLIYKYLNKMLALHLCKYLTKKIKDKDDKIRILEVGAGIGATSEQVVKLLKKYDLEKNVLYDYSDISSFFLERGRRRYGNNPNFSFEIVNINDGEALSNLKEYDIVIAAGVLNNSKNIYTTVANLLCKIKKEGLMLITEAIGEQIEILVSQVFMMEEAEDLRMKKNKTFLTEEEWMNLFGDQGLYNIRCLPNEDNPLSCFRQRLFIVKKT